jgi:hypothetical protein
VLDALINRYSNRPSGSPSPNRLDASIFLQLGIFLQLECQLAVAVERAAARHVAE